MHKYICERCKKHKACNITGCKGECVKVCGKCFVWDWKKWEKWKKRESVPSCVNCV